MQTTFDQAAVGMPEGREELIDFYRNMVLIRRFEEKAEEMYTRARIGGYCHLNIGEEAAYVGAYRALSPHDYCFSSYKDHGIALLSGSSSGAVMAELFGKETGVAHGRGGSMHMVNAKAGFFGGYGIVGGQLPLAVGAALAIDYEDRRDVVMCFMGDGSVNIGAFHESLNLAKVWQLPVVFVVVNNQYGMGTSVEEASGEPELYKRAAAYRIPGERVDGNDVIAVHRAASRIVQVAREERMPGLLELITYRYRGHSVADPGKNYRTPEEIASWQRRDPIVQLRDKLSAQGLLNSDEIAAIEADVEREVQEATDFATNSPDPNVDSLLDNVYGPEYDEQAARMAPGAAFGDVWSERGTN